MEYGITVCRFLCFSLLDLYKYTGVGRLSDWNYDKPLHQTMQGCAQSDVTKSDITKYPHFARSMIAKVSMLNRTYLSDKAYNLDLIFKVMLAKALKIKRCSEKQIQVALNGFCWLQLA